MKILVINAGSSSLKFQLIEMQTEECLCSGVVERIGADNSCIKYKAKGKETVITAPLSNHTQSFHKVMECLLDKEIGVISNINEIAALGHRVVHSGEVFDKSTLMNMENLQKLDKVIDMAPLHNPPAKACILSCMEVLPNVPNVAVFDTSFHTTMPKKASLYGIPYEDYEKYSIKKYGFHGTSHKFVSGVAVDYLKNNNCNCDNIVTCHLGNGSSISAVKEGKCIDTSMGMTPLAGVVMGTRCGDIDPAVVEMLAEKKGLTLSQTLNYLNKSSGFLGISGLCSDCRDLVEAAKGGNQRAELTLDMFAYHVKKYIGSYAAVMNGLDCIVFTGGIGENSIDIRGRILSDMDFLGIKYNPDIIKSKEVVTDISSKDSKVKVLIIQTNEELVIARETKAVAESLK